MTNPAETSVASYPVATRIVFPVEPYEPSDPRFGESVQGAGGLFGIHLGEDVCAVAGTVVRSVADGLVVYSGFHPGSAEKGNWGNIVIVGHRHPVSGADFFTLYGHLGPGAKPAGDLVAVGEPLGAVGAAYTAENGWWEAHLHFAIYTGPWTGNVLPGYFREGSDRTRSEYWVDPSAFIRPFLRNPT
ncbi:MAG: M23 family metallopeptidase [Candidatus Moranbacteria bacterium]|nr:M23 family metallopeptidase [Candidatus Moranbacteria bacterium]